MREELDQYKEEPMIQEHNRKINYRDRNGDPTREPLPRKPHGRKDEETINEQERWGLEEKRRPKVEPWEKIENEEEARWTIKNT